MIEMLSHLENKPFHYIENVIEDVFWMTWVTVLTEECSLITLIFLIHKWK